MGYNPCGCKKSDMTEHSTAQQKMAMPPNWYTFRYLISRYGGIWIETGFIKFGSFYSAFPCNILERRYHYQILSLSLSFFFFLDKEETEAWRATHVASM